MKRVIIFLIRKRLGLKKDERFQFTNQASKTDCYYFSDDSLMKVSSHLTYKSSVSLNWLLDDMCEIRKV